MEISSLLPGRSSTNSSEQKCIAVADCRQTAAIASISISTSFGSLAAWMHVRAGLGEGKSLDFGVSDV